MSPLDLDPAQMTGVPREPEMHLWIELQREEASNQEEGMQSMVLSDGLSGWDQRLPWGVLWICDTMAEQLALASSSGHPLMDSDWNPTLYSFVQSAYSLYVTISPISS